MIDHHFVVHPRLCKYLIDFGISERKISVKLDYSKCNHCTKICSKKEHNGINVAYYYPGDRGNKKFKQWVYGKDIIDQIISMFPGVNWIQLDGTKDICEIYPILDGYIRPNRHDGFPLIIIECLILNIPYYWNEEFHPSIGGVYFFVLKIKKKKREGKDDCNRL